MATPISCGCQAKLYKKNGLPCGTIKCKNHFSYSPAAEKETLATHETVFPKTFIVYLTKSLQPGDLSYPTVRPCIAKLFPLCGDVATLLVSQVITYVYTKPTIAEFAKSLSMPPTALPAFFVKMHRVESTSSLRGALCHFQRQWRGWRRRKNEKIEKNYTNSEDPFTMEPLCEIPPTLLWEYTDAHGHLYGFHASSLHYFINHHGKWNPYTRDPIPEADIERLNAQVAAFAPEDTTDFTVVWRTPRDAFVDVLHDYERFGFYTDIQWFLGLTPYDVIHVYFTLSINTTIVPMFFDITPLETSILEDPEHGAMFHLAREMQRLIQDPTDIKFYIVCNLFVALSKVCPGMRAALPQWARMVV